MKKNKPVQKLLAANRSEVAIRIFRAATELGLRTVAIYSQEDRLALHRFKADQAYQVGAGKGPVEAYLDIAGIVPLNHTVERGAKLLTLEAMKMQSNIYAPIAGRIVKLLATPGQHVEAKDLLVAIAP
jgi:pyruvate carboxylase